jgi:hypothetical protein
MSRFRAMGLALAVAVAVSASACAGGRISLGTGASACFRDLPAATDAVHNKGTLQGVRRVSAASLRARLPRDTTLATLPDQELCVFAFKGTYPPGSVNGAHNAETGHYAVISVTTKNAFVVAASVTNRLPTRFQHLH